MTQVRIGELEANLSEYLRSVLRGHSITVLDRGIPIARLVPYVEGVLLRVRPSKRRARSIHDVELPPPLPIDLDVVDLLLEERQGNR
jgi:prevent-host-death family protein